ncbi:MAG TPA: hypothetical protein VNH64_08360, partial [Parvularculaceae bacterium]|nr:hypothetical protein [Parvularculaceae bacterium]
HSPVMTALAPGVLRIRNGAEERRIFVRGGFAEVTPKGLTVLAEEAVPVSELNAEALATRIKNAEQDLADADASQDTKERAAAELVQLKQLQAAI